MASWKYDGKIAGNFPWGAVNFDVKKIIFADSTHTYSQDGDETNAVNKIYYIPAGVIPTQANLESFRIWHRYQVNDLVGGTQTVCIEYVPEEDVQLSSLAIFTDDEESSKTVNFGIIHESGLVVYKSTEDDVSGQMTKYNLSGYRRYKSGMSGITLKKGLKYYIHWTNTNNTFKPAYFENTAGNYLDWNHGTLQQKSVANLNSAAEYLGVVSDVAIWLAADENDFMIANGINGLNTNDAYIRNNVCNGAAPIGESGQSLPPIEKDKLLSLATGTGFMYIGNNVSESGVDIFVNTHIYEKSNALSNAQYKGMKTTLNAILPLNVGNYCVYTGENDYGTSPQMIYNYVYRKKKDVVVNVNYTCSHGGTQLETAYIVDASCDPTTNKNVAVNGSWWYADRKGAVYTLKSDYHAVDLNKSGDTINGYDPTTVSTLAANTIIYFYKGDQCPLIGSHVNAGVYFWNGSTLAEIGQNTLETYFNVTTLSDMIEVINLSGVATEIGSVSALTKTHYNGDYISNKLRGQTVQTDKKFYLEINGSEV